MQGYDVPRSLYQTFEMNGPRQDGVNMNIL